MKKFEKDFLGRFVQKDLMGNSSVVPTDSLSITDQIEFMKVPNGTPLRHEECPGGQTKIFWEPPVQYPPSNRFNASSQRPMVLPDEISPTLSSDEAMRILDLEKVRTQNLRQYSSPSTPSFDPHAIKATAKHFGILVKDLIRNVDQWVCPHSRSTKNGGRDWSCGYSKDEEVRCELLGSTIDKCVDFIVSNAGFTEEHARGVLEFLKRNNCIEIYKCGAVFFK